MIVNKPIGAQKIGNLSHRLTVGHQVPQIVLDYWKKTKLLKVLIDAGIILDENNIKEIVKNDVARPIENGQPKNIK